MSEENKSIELPAPPRMLEELDNPLTEYTIKGTDLHFYLNEFDALVEIQRISKETARDDNGSIRYIELFAKWLNGNVRWGGEPTEFTPSIAYTLYNHLQLKAAEEKKDYLERLNSLTGSQE